MEHAIHRLAFIVLCSVLSACATVQPQASNAQVTELLAEVRALREEQARLAAKVDRLELQNGTYSSSTLKTGSPKSDNGLQPEMPLTVVKLKPQGQPSPRLTTQIPVVEPSADDIAQASDDRAPELDPAILEAQYDAALDALKTGNIEGGILKLEQFAKENVKHPRADNALYFSALGRLGLKQFGLAAETLERLLARYPAGDAVPDALVKLAECRVRQKQADDARALYAKVIAHYPGTTAASEARDRLASLKRGTP